MSVYRLNPVAVSKPWGSTRLPDQFASLGESRTGEVWFTDAPDFASSLLVKYLFTTEKLSVQVHPNDEDAICEGFSRGKSECWYVVEAEPDARLGIGLVRPMSAQDVRAAALDGSLENDLDWKAVSAGSFYYIPAGTVHAIGGGLQIVEIQQNADVTYRLYDYGRPRELHLDRGLPVAQLAPYRLADKRVSATRSQSLVESGMGPFRLESIVVGSGEVFDLAEGVSWFVPLKGHGLIDGQPWQAGECWVSDERCGITAHSRIHVLVAQAATASGR